MGPGFGLIVGIPFVVLTLALLVIIRRERLRRDAGREPSRWLPLYRLLAAVLVLFTVYIVVGTVIAGLNAA